MTAAGDCGVFDPVKQARDSCVFGAEDSARTMVVIGDSHAAQYVDPLVLAGAPTGWNVQAMVRNGCPFSSSPPRSVNTVFQGCADANALSVAMILDQKPDLVVVSGMKPESYARELKWRWTDDESLQKGYEDLLGQLRAENIRVAVVPDIPLPEGSVPDCVALHGSSPECGVPVPTAFPTRTPSPWPQKISQASTWSTLTPTSATSTSAPPFWAMCWSIATTTSPIPSPRPWPDRWDCSWACRARDPTASTGRLSPRKALHRQLAQEV